MKEKDFIKKDLKEIFSLFNDNNQTKLFEKSNNSLDSYKLSTQLLKDINNKSNEKNNSKYKENEIRIGNYLIKKTIGKGTFGKVKLGVYLPRNQKVAIKILEKRKIRERDDLIRLKREFEMLSQFNHPNVITVSEIFETSKAYFTVMEFCEGGELFNYIVANKYLSEEKSAFFYYQLISGLEYIHSLGIVHRDLKPENLLLTHEHILKIIDFGLSNYFKNGQMELLETPCGSPCYASPEMLSGNRYNGFKIDIWATGIILFAMLCGYLPFDDKDNNILFQKILECKIIFPKGLSHEAKDLMKKILVTNPKKRITIPEIKQHPFYIKGKEIFEKNFTIYQVTAEDLADSSDSSYFYDFKNMNDNNSEKNLLFCDTKKKSEIIINKHFKNGMFLCQKNQKRSLSCKELDSKNKNEISLEDSAKNRIKKLMNLEKKLKKFAKKEKKKKKINKINNIELFFQERNKFILGKENIIIQEGFLKYNHSLIFHIKDINNFVENLIIQYKIEEELNKLNLHNKTEKLEGVVKKHKKITKSEDNNNYRINKFQKKMKESNINNKVTVNNIKNKNKKYKQIGNDKEKNKKEESKKFFDVKEFLKTETNSNTIFNKKLISPKRKSNFYTLNNKNIKLNNKRKESSNINKLFINNNKKIKINKLPQSIKFKKLKRRIRSSSNNNSKKQNFKNILNKIKQNSKIANINLIKKKNIIHHHITNITNMTQKNYFSNVIINNYKGKEEYKVNCTSKNKSKMLLDNFPSIKNDKNINLKSNINQTKKRAYKNSKLKNNLQKLIFKDDFILKSGIKLNSKTIINPTSEESKKLKKTKNNKIQIKSKEKEKGLENKTIPISNNKKMKKYKIKVSSIKNLNKGFNKNVYLNTGNSIRNSSLNKDKDKKEINIKNSLYNDNKYKFLLTEILRDEETNKRSKPNYLPSTENSYSNRSNKKTIINSLEKNKIFYNKSNRFWYPNASKKMENLKKNNLQFKKLIKFKNFPKLNIKDIISNYSSIIKTEPNSLKYQKDLNLQRNNPNIINSNRKLPTYHYLNSARINDNKIINNSYNIGNNFYLGNLTENNPFLNKKIVKLCKFKTSQNNIRNKNSLNSGSHNHLNNFIFNATNDSIRLNKTNNKNIFNTNNNELNSLIMNKKNINKNNCDKIFMTNKLLSSLKKRTNLKPMQINGNFDKKTNDEVRKNSNKNNNGYENKSKINNNSVIINFPNSIKNIKLTDNKKIGNNNFKKNECLKFKTELYNSLQVDKKRHKKIKNMKEKWFKTKTKKDSKTLVNLY